MLEKRVEYYNLAGCFSLSGHLDSVQYDYYIFFYLYYNHYYARYFFKLILTQND